MSFSEPSEMRFPTTLSGLALAAVFAAGCEEGSYQDYSKAPLSEGHDHGHDHDHDHGHDHGGHAGKYGGHVLELDDTHGHHAEMVFDKATRDITLYFYGSEIGVGKPATGLAFEIEKDGAEVVLEAKASPLEGETEATASRFVIAGSQLPEAIKSEEQLDGHFHVTVDGKELVGEFHAHSHDEHAHDDHGHAEGDHAHDEHAHGEGEAKAEHKDDDHKPAAEKSEAPSADAPKTEAAPAEAPAADAPKADAAPAADTPKAE
jgi:hypothetical protein